MNNTLVLDIQRSSLHDGPGVRTTVFLKGCPLRCLWCHNPESQNFKKELSLNLSRCTLCGKCADVCENGVHKIIDGVHHVDKDKCTFCGKCEKACINDAIQIMGKEMSAQEVFEIVKKDKIFYDSTGGGVTVSGGEALSHPSFCKELLSLCKESGIHTCIETSGYAPRKVIEEIAPVVDLFLYDWKVSSREKGMKYIGVDGKIIYENLQYLASMGKKIILRCPIIPTVNNDEEHFSRILDIVNTYPQVQCAEMLPYHNFGVVKGENLGRETAVFPVPEESEKAEWLSWFESHGTDKVKFA